jgi:hypothetical protein
VIGAKVPQPSMLSKPSRAIVSKLVGATTLTFRRRPVRLVGSANVAMSFGCGISGSGLRAVSNTTSGPSPSGVRRAPVGTRSTTQAEAATARPSAAAVALPIQPGPRSRGIER